jgi:GPH family glycoside/pentoside/hexuronide:cation symporter
MASEPDSPLPLSNHIEGGKGELETLTRKPSPLFYGMGMLGFSISVETFNTFAYFYYVDFLGLAITVVALARTIYAIWDAVNDPLFGYLSDNTRGRLGRRRPWLLMSVPLLALCFVFIFIVPVSPGEKGQLFWYLLGITLLFETLITIVGVNYNALFPELFRSLPERVQAGAYTRGGLIIGQIIGLSLTPLVYQHLGFQKMAVIYAALTGGLLFIASLKHREDSSYQTQDKDAPWATFREVLRGRAFWLYAIMLMIFAFAINLLPFAIPFYIKYTLGADEGAVALIFGAVLVAALGSMPVWVKLYHRWGTRRVFLRSMGIIIIGCVGLGLAPNLTTAILAVGVTGSGWGGCLVCFDVIRAGLVDRHFDLTGQRSEGVYFSLLNFGVHLSGVLQAAAMVIIGSAFGYMSGDHPGPQPGNAFRFLISVFPVVALLLAMQLAHRFFIEYIPSPPPD